uniref:CAAX prenyl protease 2 n=2 Tax=Hymenolepis diminuta TaxID=6216 RepID=A0A158QFS3_HYMDI
LPFLTTTVSSSFLSTNMLSIELNILTELRYKCDIIWLRAVVVAPLVEEIIFRGCILFQLQRQFQTCGALCLGSGLLFAIAHSHHVVEKLYIGYPLNAALSEVFPQVIMTAMFGVYSTLIVLRSGHLIAACIVHSFCNAMGAPDILGDLKYVALSDPRRGKRIYLTLLFSGFIGWLLLIGPATTLFGFSNTTQCRLFYSFQLYIDYFISTHFVLMSIQPTYDSTLAQLGAFLKAKSPLAVENAFTTLSNSIKYVDYCAHLIRCLQSTINDANFDKIEVATFFSRVIRLLKCLVPMKMKPEFMGEKPPAKSEQAKRVKISALRHALTRTWGKLLEKGLSDDLMLEALVTLGDDQIEKMIDTAQLLGPYITLIFDPPANSNAASFPSWSRAVTRALLKVIHTGGLNYDRLYLRLYALLGEDLLICPYADRFLLDLDVYLTSIHVPAGWLSAFSKRLIQLSLIGTAPLSIMSALITVGGNVLIRHPPCRVLIDRSSGLEESTSTTTECGPGGDPYVYHPGDLARDASDALASSLWELICLECHYQADIANLANRIRHIASDNGMNLLPDVKNQVESGKQLQNVVDRASRQYMSVLEMTNARMPSLTALEGWFVGTEISQAMV